MKKALALMLSAFMLLACLTGITLTASAEGEVVATLTPDDLVAGEGIHALTATKEVDDDGTEYVRYVTNDADPYIWYNSKASVAGSAQFMKIVYRTSTACTTAEYFCHTTGYANVGFEYINDGEWHSIIIDLTQNSQHSPQMGQFRIDPLTGANDSNGVVDYQYVEFFNSKELAADAYTLNLTTNPFADGIPSIDIGSDLVLGGSLVMPDGDWTSWHYAINGGNWAPATYEAGENGAFENLVIPTNTLSGGIHTVSLQARNDQYQCVTLSAIVYIDLTTVVVGEGTTGQLFNGGTGGSSFGVHINAYGGLNSFTVQSLANYGNSTDKMKVEAYAWNTDIETTLAGTCVWTTEVTGITDNGDTTVEVPAGKLAGEIYLQFTPVDGQLTAKAADTSVNSDVEFFVNGAKVDGGFMGYYVAANPAEMIWDLTTGAEDIDFLAAQDASVIKATTGYIKAIATAEGATITNVGANLNPGFKYFAIVYRTKTADAAITVNGGEPVALTADGLWNVTYVDLDNTGLETVADLAVGFAGSIDIAYIGMYKSTALREASANAGVAGTLNRTLRAETYYDAEKDTLVDIGVMNTNSPVFVYDFSLWLNDPAATYGFRDLTHLEVAEHNPANGYVTFNVTADDPYLTLGVAPTGYANQLGYMVIKYRTSAATAGGEFFTATSGGYGWANPIDKTHVTHAYVNDGEWHTTIVDASAVWGDLYGQSLQNFRFDPIVGASGSIDISYIAFYTNLAAAEAAAAADEGVAPTTPIDPSTIVSTVYDGESLFSNLGVSGCSGAYNYAEGYMTLTSLGGDPNYYLFINYEQKVGPILAIKYRTTSALANDNKNEGFIGVGEGASGSGDQFTWANPVINDGEWHIAYADISSLTKVVANEDGTYTVNYFRVDFLRDAGYLDVAYIGFFGSVDELNAYDAQIWTAPKYYKVTFMADEQVVKEVYYREGTESISSPSVPKKDGFTGEWEAFEMGKDVVVNAVYTEIPETTEPVTTEPATSETEPVTTEPATSETETEPTVTEPVTTEPAGTDEPQQEKQGCKSALAVGAVVALTSMIALGAVCFKKKD